ncbi:hypothetical protein GUJ93_ZPchr0012g21042 [Zizania palustris]|uniref:BTB domain-containing protein n=1 Tax=Zizania palustris TaxID=103762 RepID=A0A8J5WKN0_ZIZPA|nr:hypothetical protein GUJ93_ZPchr0012g21042 [Zizania palustris]
MKYMKLGSKPDVFQTEGNNIRFVATELATDIVITVGDVKFHRHKFPLLSKSWRLQTLVASTNEESNDEVDISDIPGGPAAFEICAKFCYGMIVTLNAYNVLAARCAAEYLEMFETIDKGNLIYKIDVFLSSSILRTWKDSIIVLQTTKLVLPWSENLKVINHCVDSITSKASIDPSEVEWSYTYNRRKLPSERGLDSHWNGVRKKQMVPRDWWVEDLCDLEMCLYKRVILAIKAKGRIEGKWPISLQGASQSSLRTECVREDFGAASFYAAFQIFLYLRVGYNVLQFSRTYNKAGLQQRQHRPFRFKRPSPIPLQNLLNVLEDIHAILLAVP